MLRKKYYFLFVSREEDGRVKKVSIPLHYVYGFVTAAMIGTFTIVGLAGSYTRMLLKTESFNQVREDRENLRRNYQQMQQQVHDSNVQVASLGALASEVTAIYGLRKTKLTATPKVTETTPTLSTADNVDQQQVQRSVEQFYKLRAEGLSGRVSRALDSGLTTSFAGDDWTSLVDAPTMWPVQGIVTSSFGQREDPFNGEGKFHAGLDISAPSGTPVRATADGDVSGASLGSGYGREVELNHGHDLATVYGHLLSVVVVPGQHVVRGQIIGYVGRTGRATGPHLHYEVRVHNVPVNPHKYLRDTYQQVMRMDANSPQG